MNVPIRKTPGNADSSNFHAIRYNEQTGKSDIIDPGVQTNESTLQAFTSVIRDIAGNISSVLPEEKEMRVFLENIGWDGGSTDFPDGGGERPWNPPGSDEGPGGDAKEATEERVLVPAPVRRTQRHIENPSS
jgi:hypothetical protein